MEVIEIYMTFDMMRCVS